MYAPGPLGTTPPHPRLLLELGDQLGSASVILDQETGEVVERVAYDANGTVESDYRPARWHAFREDMRFTGKEEDIEVGLTYFGARYLSTTLRRWISPDPLTVHGWGADANPYAYVSGRTMSAVDPWGLYTVDEAGNRTIADVTTITGQVPTQPTLVTGGGSSAPEIGEPQADPRIAQSADRIARLVGRTAADALAPGVHQFPGGLSYHEQDVPAHIVNGLVSRGVHGTLDIAGIGGVQKAINFYTGGSIGVVEAAESVVRHVKIPVPDRGAGDITRGTVTGFLVVAEALLAGRIAGGAAEAAEEPWLPRREPWLRQGEPRRRSSRERSRSAVRSTRPHKGCERQPYSTRLRDALWRVEVWI